MGHKYSRDEILEGALQAAFDDGLSQLTFGRLAKRLSINDRTIVYYFPTKADLITDTLMAMAAELQSAIAHAFSKPARDYVEMVERAWPLVSKPETDRVFALFFEANGLAAVGADPYESVMPALIEGWIDWAAELVSGTKRQRQQQAAAAIAAIDGLIILRLLCGPAMANQAAKAITG